jgi:peroxiredoxin
MPKLRKSVAEPAPRKPLRSRWLRWAAQAALLVAVLAVVSVWQTRSHLSSDGPAPDFTLRDLDGREVRLSELRGKRVLLHFWATWCGVCKLEPGALNAVHDRLGDDELVLALVSDGADEIPAVRQFVKQHEIRYPVLIADDAVLRAYRVNAFPTNYFIAPDGRISSSSIGLTTRFALWARMGCAR